MGGGVRGENKIWGGVRGSGWGGGKDGGVRRIELIVKIIKKKDLGWGSGGGVGGRGWEGGGDKGGCERRIEVFVKIPKKNVFFFFWGGGIGLGGGGRVGGVRVDVNEELKFL